MKNISCIGGVMRKVAQLVVLLVSLSMVGPVWGKTPYLAEDELKTEAKAGFEKILDLWRDGKFDEVYERTTVSGKQTKEEFIARLADAKLRPACCWEKLQEVKIAVKGDSAVTVRAKLGFEGNGTTEFKTRSFKLVKEEGVWCIAQSDLLSLAGAKKKKGVHRKKKTVYLQ
jgi:hypothetical protein